MARARRQPGSALKPFAYAMAFERGMSPTEMLADVPARFGDRAGEWAPVNFDGTFWGPMSAREALAGSLNVPAVRIATDIGESAFLDRLHRLGFASLDRAAGHYGLALVLGAGEVTLTELAASYATIARGGEGLALRFRAGTDGLGAVQHGPTVIEAAAAAAIADALSDPQARIRGLGSVGPFDIGYPVAVKTGTSSGYRDAWAAGFTHERTVAVWVGNPDGRATVDLTGALGAGPLFSDVMKRAMRDVGTRAPLWQDALLTTVRVCPLSGKRVGDACPHGVNRRVPAAVAASTATCELHRRASRTTGPIGWRCDASGSATIVTLPEAFTAWLASQPVGAPGRDVQGLPWLPMAAVPDCSSSQTSASLRIEDPPAGAVLLAGHEGTASVEVAASWIGAKTGAEVEIALDGKAIARLREPFRGHFDVARGDHRLVIRPVDPNVAVRTAVVDFSVR
jgi:penicillin-binding protein 1C